MSLRPRIVVKFWQSGGRRRCYLAYVRWLGLRWCYVEGELPAASRTAKVKEVA